MTLETLYTASKWDLLKLLENDTLTPQELAQKTNTSRNNVAQQLKLLEIAGLVHKKRTKGKTQYSLAKNSCYVISTSKQLVQKKQIPVNTTHQVILKIWFLKNQELRRYAEKAFWKIEEYLPEIEALYLDLNSTQPINLYLVTQKELSIPEIQTLRHKDDNRTAIIQTVTQEGLKGIQDKLQLLYQQ